MQTIIQVQCRQCSHDILNTVYIERLKNTPENTAIHFLINLKSIVLRYRHWTLSDNPNVFTKKPVYAKSTKKSVQEVLVSHDTN